MTDISIVLPIHGDGEYLQKTLESIESQTFSGALETILILDRCTESTFNVIANFKSLRNMQVIPSNNPGLVSALNEGLRFASGKYIARIDADDLMLPSRLQLQFEYLELHADVIVLGTDVIEINEDGEEIGFRNYPTTAKSMFKALNLQCTVAHSSTLFRKDVILELGGYRAFFEHAEDYDLWLRARLHGKVISLASAQTFYRVHSKQISRSQYKARVFGSYSARLNGYLERRGRKSLIQKYVTFENWQNSQLGACLTAYVMFRLSVSKRIENSAANSGYSLFGKIVINPTLRGMKKLKAMVRD
jgi:glycosyltransferase involved in cell wall biosynthesis